MSLPSSRNPAVTENELEKDGDEYLRAITYSRGHARRRDKLQADLVKIIKENKETFGPMAELIEDPNCCGRMVPKVFVSLGGEKTLNKINTVSHLFWLLFKDMPNTKAKEGECPYLEPDSENTKIRSLLGCMSQEYGWNYQLNTDFNFTGSFAEKMQFL